MDKIKVLVNGCNGHMGQTVCRLIAERYDMKVVAGFDKSVKEDFYQFPVFTDIEDLKTFLDGSFGNGVFPDVIIDFSSPTCTVQLLDKVVLYDHIPIVIATTGFSDEDISYIQEIAEESPIFLSSNMSFEIKLLETLLRDISPKFAYDHDVEISEAHHSRKKDTPSGTANMFANAINEALDNKMEIVYGRSGKRNSNEIGVSSIKGGNIAGGHTVRFIGQFDELVITYRAFSRELFAENAITAALFMADETSPGLFDMNDLY